MSPLPFKSTVVLDLASSVARSLQFTALSDVPVASFTVVNCVHGTRTSACIWQWTGLSWYVINVNNRMERGRPQYI